MSTVKAGALTGPASPPLYHQAVPMLWASQHDCLQLYPSETAKINAHKQTKLCELFLTNRTM